jgi:hypothetical protein
MPGSLSGRYAIAGLGMVVGLPAKELAERKAKSQDWHLEQAVPSPLEGLTARDLEAEAARRAVEDAGLNTKDIDGAVHVHGGPRSGGGMLEQNDAFPRMLGLPVNFYYRLGRGGAWGTFGITTAPVVFGAGRGQVCGDCGIDGCVDGEPQKDHA